MTCLMLSVIPNYCYLIVYHLLEIIHCPSINDENCHNYHMIWTKISLKMSFIKDEVLNVITMV